MSDDEVGCAAVRELAPELALGVVSGPERAAAIAHLDRCTSCRRLVEELASTTDAVALLAPHAEPRPGFEARVLDRLRGAPRRRSRRGVLAWVAAAACVLALVGVLVVDDGLGGGRDRRGFERAALRTVAGRDVGEAYLYPSRGQHSAWLYLSMPGWSEWAAANAEPTGSTGYTLRIELADGQQQAVAVPAPAPGNEGWGGSMSAEPDEIVAVALVDGDGRVLCSAEL